LFNEPSERERLVQTYRGNVDDLTWCSSIRESKTPNNVMVKHVHITKPSLSNTLILVLPN